MSTNNPYYIDHVLFTSIFPVNINGMTAVNCQLKVSFMRYDEDYHLFFPVSIYADTDDIYISAKYRLYPNGDVILIRKSGDIDDDIESQVLEGINKCDLPSHIIEFVAETRYDELIEAQSC